MKAKYQEQYVRIKEINIKNKKRTKARITIRYIKWLFFFNLLLVWSNKSYIIFWKFYDFVMKNIIQRGSEYHDQFFFPYLKEYKFTQTHKHTHIIMWY